MLDQMSKSQLQYDFGKKRHAILQRLKDARRQAVLGETLFEGEPVCNKIQSIQDEYRCLNSEYTKAQW